MKATEFVRRFGLEEAAEIVQGTPSKYMECYHSSVCWDTNTYKYSDRFKPRNSLVNIADLKRLVESHELVIVWRMPGSWRDDYDGDKLGLEGARMYLDMHGNHELVGEKLERFKQAIADVEACREVS